MKRSITAERNVFDRLGPSIGALFALQEVTDELTVAGAFPEI